MHSAARDHAAIGWVFLQQGMVSEAVSYFRASLEMEPASADLHNCLGLALNQLGSVDESQQCYEEAIRLRPEFPEARFNRSLTWLTNGDFSRGWPEYEWRLQCNPTRYQIPPGPRWNGDPLNGRTLLVASEGGLGDSLNFVRYAALAKQRGATVLFHCAECLASLAATCPGVDRVASRPGAGVTYDAHIPLMSLPALFGVPPDTAPPVPYLTPDPARVAYWRGELSGVTGLRVGIAWQGNPRHDWDKFRSVHLKRFVPLIAVPGVTVCCLQQGHGAEQLLNPAGLGVLDLGASTGPEMMDTAAVMMNLDLVITVDSSLAHLAGALGRPVWVALPFVPDWRWGREAEATRWYPSMRLFRQTARGDWNDVFGRLAASLRVAAEAKAEGRCTHTVAQKLAG